jgi:DNA primase
MAIPQTFIQELLARADVVEIVGRYVQLKKGGANFMGLCPFHGEKSPSFSVSPTKQFYHCFGCGKNGNAIGFLMDHAGMTFIEAVKDLAQQYGMQVPEDEASPQDRERAAKQREKQATLTDVLEKAGEAYRKHLKAVAARHRLPQGPGPVGRGRQAVRPGLCARGLAQPGQRVPQLRRPAAGRKRPGHRQRRGRRRRSKRYDRFRDRVMFPIRNVKGECIGFGGRVLGDEKPKYLNSPKPRCSARGASCMACSRPARPCASRAMCW